MNKLEIKTSTKEKIDGLIRSGAVRNMSQLAESLGYNRATLSTMLNVENDKNVSELFLRKLDEKYFPADKKMADEEMRRVLATQEVLMQTCAQLTAQSNGKSFAVALAELKQAVNMNL